MLENGFMPNQLSIAHEGELLQRLNDIIVCMPDNVYWMDTNSTFLGCNENVLILMGLTKEQYVGISYDDLVKMGLWPEEQANSFKRDDLEVVRTGQAKHNVDDPPIPGPDGKLVYYKATRVPIKNKSGKVIGIVGISRDVTEEKLAQKREKQALQEAAIANAKVQAQEEIQKAVLTFSGAISHDLRTPLSTIQIVTTLLDKMIPILVQAYRESTATNDDLPALSEQQLSSLESSCRNIMSATLQADSYIDATLKIIRGAATGSELLKPEDLVPCPIEDIIRRVVRALPGGEEEDTKIHYDTSKLFSFMGNSIFMSRILQNLIKNAFEQIQLKGKGEIFIWCENSQDFNYLKIKDTAGGVSAETIKHIFDGFNSTKKGGAGLGLSSAKQIMQAFNGDIGCDIVEGDCIEFTLSFPVTSLSSS